MHPGRGVRGRLLPHRRATTTALNLTSAANGYSKLADLIVGRERFAAQSVLAAKGDLRAMRLDEDFPRAMEYAHAGGGCHGNGRRLAHDGAHRSRYPETTILFPLVRPE